MTRSTQTGALFLVVGIAMLVLAPAAMAQQQTVGPQEPGDVYREPSVVNGTAIGIRQAPWQVFVRSTTPGGTSSCGGSILDADIVITAAHCTFDEDVLGNPVALAAASFTVRSGISNFDAPAADDQEQAIGVSAVRVHPEYSPVAGAGSPDDVATLELAAPLDIAGDANTRNPIPLSTAAPALFTGANLTGFGQQDPAVDPNGQLFGLDTVVQDPVSCGGPANALYVCIVSGTGSACRGDSGGPMTQAGALIGVASFVTGPDVNSICRPNSLNGYTNVTAAEINDFIEGDDTPPLAPRGGDDISASGTFEAGGSITCAPGTWTNGPTFTYTFLSTQNDDDLRNNQVLQSGPSRTYTFRAANVGQTVACQVSASNAGGTGISRTEATPPIRSDPTPDPPDDDDDDAQPRRARLAVSIAAGRSTVRSGGRVPYAIRVRNRGRAPARRVVMCDTPGRGLAFTGVPRGAQRSNGRVCFRVRSLRAGSSRSFRIVLRATRTRRARTVSNAVTARASNARTLRRDSARVRVRGTGRVGRPRRRR